MEDDQQNEPGLLLAWILGIAVTLAIVVAVLSGVLGALNSAPAGSAPTPAAAAAKPAETAAAAPIVQAKLYFETGKADLPADSAALMAAVLETIKGGKAKKLVISGFHDATGDPARNAELAKQRAFAVRDLLSASGVAADALELSKPQETTGGTDEREARRVEISAF